MRSNDFNFLESKILTDKEFAKFLSDNPEQALKREGIRITPEVLDAIQGMDGSAVQKLIHTMCKDQPEE